MWNCWPPLRGVRSSVRHSSNRQNRQFSPLNSVKSIKVKTLRKWTTFKTPKSYMGWDIEMRITIIHSTKQWWNALGNHSIKISAFLGCQPKKQYFLKQTFSLCNVQTTVDITPICSYRNNIMEKLGRQENLCIWICISYSKFKSQLEMQNEITKANSQFRFLTKFFFFYL